MFNIRDLPTPKNITVMWNFGRLLGLILCSQILTGLMLSFHYTGDVSLAFDSVRHIVRDVNKGWWLRNIHANGASFFFVCIYCHIGRGIYYGRYRNFKTWLSGFVLLLMLIATAFLGYVLPWGQMRFWGATVITNLFRALPYGEDLVYWIWGGFSVDNATLTRFFSLHFIIPLTIVLGAAAHISLLHETGRSNPLGLDSSAEKIPFHSYFTIKDVVGFVCVLFFLFGVCVFVPNLFGEPDNFISANPLSTPSHIVPEWYFLFAYAILRSIPSKLGGVLALFASVLVLAVLPTVSINIKSLIFYPVGKVFFWGLVLAFVLLSLAGGSPVEEPYLISRRFLTFFFFVSSFFLVRLCCESKVDLR